MNQQKEKTSYIYYLLINFAANSKKSATFLKLSNCWQYMPTFELTLIFSIYLKSSFLSFFKIVSSSTFGNPNPAHF